MTMKKLERIRYNTMNSWNQSKAPAYNIKIYNVIPNNLRQKVYELLETDEIYAMIDNLIMKFDSENNYVWQAGINGRSGGYLVLYKGGLNNGRSFVYPGKNIDNSEVPEDVFKRFDKLANDIVKQTIKMAKEYNIKEETYLIEKKRKVLVRAKK